MNSNHANVTGQPNLLEGKQFTCPLCSVGLTLKSSKKGKPYCTCDDCGIQIFFRGKAAIGRLERLATEGRLMSLLDAAADGGSLEANIDALVIRKVELEEELGDGSDSVLENTIAKLEAEIEEEFSKIAEID
jgi:hypothetical protein